MASSSFKKCEGESTRKPNWLELPIDLTKNILQRLDTLDIMLSARNVCHLWWHIFKDPLMWRTIHISNIEHIPYNFCSLEKIVRCVVDLSCGHLEDIALELFCTDDLLKYIAHRASNLRRLQISDCNNISNRGLVEFVKMFSQLEELHISFKYLSKESIEVIGRFCPLLKSLNFDGPLDTYFDFYDEVFAIGKTMPGLRHLSFSRIVFDNDQLFAILDGCPLIESLDLQHCFVRHLSPSMEKRCREQIKDFQLPIYNDYEDDIGEDGFAYMPFEHYDDEFWEQDYKFAIATWSHKGFRYPADCCVKGCTCRSLNYSKHYPKFSYIDLKKYVSGTVL
ncbi:putative F-box/LRR-repeat protein 9 [Vicia villosa]|uniref:putative F-box/LRR-repeat protein 9 n=1 Tax=Vicia villosa TaxID=3911 RepID=UPI00273CB57F|nr:putative F-box/LRR-repeat protein 9 [Vicia villosa]